MHLALKYTPSKQYSTCAAIINSASPAAWLLQLSQWGIAVEEADYFILPKSIHTTQAAGLFVVFKNPDITKKLEITYPYGQASEGLFLPANAVLYPQVTEQDLKRILLWKYQLFHPTIGLVGFEDSDKVHPASWLDVGVSLSKNWSYANEGNAELPPLRLIQVQPPTGKDVLEDVEKSINKKPHTDISKENKRTEVEKVRDLIIEGALKSILFVVAALSYVAEKILSALGLKKESNTPAKPVASSKDNFFSRMFKRIDAKIADLEERRKSEINRLLDMFDKNTDEALQYALPLDSPYLNRGVEPKGTGGWLLSRRLPNFMLSGLGRGGAASSWVIENNQYETLRSKYLKAAEREIEKKDFKKAAYIYAHLLSDYRSAANVLEQGKYYREAAALYKDHIKNLVAAAECLERGGLTLDAIELYKEQNKDEKVGDLYKSIQQDLNADTYYQICFDKNLQAGDYLDAGRIAMDKLENTQLAKNVLLDGWTNNNNPDNCLKKYFDIDAVDNNLETSIKNIYSHHTPTESKARFLGVLEHINTKYPGDGEVLNTSRDIVFEIVSEETARNNSGAVKYLKSFFPEDSLLPSDSGRFLAKVSSTIVAKTNLNEILLETDTNWQIAAAHRNQFVVIGFKNKVLRMIRGNWYGDIEHYFWNTDVPEGAMFSIICNPIYSDTVFLVPETGTIKSKELLKNKYFNEVLNISFFNWMANTNSYCAITNNRDLCRLSLENENLTLSFYTIYGNLNSSVHCTYPEQMYPVTHLVPKFSSSLVHYDGYFYGTNGQLLFSVSEKGLVKTFVLEADTLLIEGHVSDNKVRLIISTEEGCIVGKGQKGNIETTDPIVGLFAEINPLAISFLSSETFVMATTNMLHVFNYDDSFPKEINTIETKFGIKSIMKTSTRNQLAVLGSDKKITFINVLPNQ